MVAALELTLELEANEAAIGFIEACTDKSARPAGWPGHW